MRGSVFFALISFRAWGATNSEADAIPGLRPAWPEIPPGVWELYGTWIVLGNILLLALIALLVWELWRPRPPVAIPPAAQARSALAPLGREPETGVVLSRVSQIVRRYFAGAFGFPAGELTTSEFCRAIRETAQVGPELSDEVSRFLRECDERKFALAPPLPPLRAVSRAAGLIEDAEKRRAASLAAERKPA